VHARCNLCYIDEMKGYELTFICEKQLAKSFFQATHLGSPPVMHVYGYGNFAILIQSEFFSLTLYLTHIRIFKMMYSDVQTKSENRHYVAHYSQHILS